MPQALQWISKSQSNWPLLLRNENSKLTGGRLGGRCWNVPHKWNKLPHRFINIIKNEDETPGSLKPLQSINIFMIRYKCLQESLSSGVYASSFYQFLHPLDFLQSIIKSRMGMWNRVHSVYLIHIHVKIIFLRIIRKIAIDPRGVSSVLAYMPQGWMCAHFLNIWK